MWTGRVRLAIGNLSVKALSLGLERACRFAIIVACAPALGQASFGRFVFASTATTLLALGTDLGLGVWTTRALARSRRDGAQVVAVGLGLRVLASVPYGLAVAAVARFIAGGEARTAMVLLGIAALAGAFVDHFAAILRGYERFVDEARLNASRALLTAAAGLFTLAAHRKLPALCMALAAASTASFVYGAATVLRLHPVSAREARAAFDGRSARAALGQSLPIWVAGLLSVLYFKVDTLFLQSLAGEAELGAYGAAYKLFEGGMVIPAVLLSVTFPQLARAHADPPEQRRLERHVVAILLGLGLSVGAILLLGGTPLVRILFGRGFDRSVPSLAVLALGVPFLFVNYGLTHFLVARDMGRTASFFALAMLVLNVVLNLLLVPRALGPGAAWATVLTEVALTACCLGALRTTSAPSRTLPSVPGATRTDRRAA
jgi:O-antigen/teichoic acid export membrane protein